MADVLVQLSHMPIEALTVPRVRELIAAAPADSPIAGATCERNERGDWLVYPRTGVSDEACGVALVAALRFRPVSVGYRPKPAAAVCGGPRLVVT